MFKKYKLLRPEWTEDRFGSGELIKVARVKALRDIPLHGVKKGDIGGWVQVQKTTILSQKDECWVGGNAIVFGSVGILDNALVTGNAIIHGGIPVKRTDDPGYYFGVSITGHAKVMDDVRIDYTNGTLCGGKSGVIGDFAVVRGNATLEGTKCIGSRSVVEGNSTIGAGSIVTGQIVIKDNAVVEKFVEIFDWVEITGEAKIQDHSRVTGATKIGGDEIVFPYSKIENGTLKEDKDNPPRELTAYVSHGQKSVPPHSSALSNDAAWNTYLRKYEKIRDQITAYSTDIVSILKYPIMTDLTNTHTAEMMFALKKAELELELKNPESFFPTVEALEMKYLVAESNARKIAASAFSDADRKKTEQAQDLFALACNEASPEPEKRNAFRQGFRKLEGVVAVPEEAIQAMRIKIGIPQLEM